MYEDKTSAEVIADSTWDGVRLVTMRCTFPRFILAEFNTHRAFSRNSASSRAIPTKKQVAQVRESPFVPTRWPRNQAGMVPFEFFEEDTWHYEAQWLKAAKQAADVAEEMANDGVHKAIASRLLEPFLWHSVIVSSTEWENFFQQRDHPDAQWEMQTLAKAMRKALDESTPSKWHYHIPFNTVTVEEQDFSMEQFMITSAARCARVSYGREMEEKTYEEDANLVARLVRGQHWSPLEHLGLIIPIKFPDSLSPCEYDNRYYNTEGNFQGPWSQLRHHWRSYLPTIAARIDSEHST
jgi:thymidylate synthase ThyX